MSDISDSELDRLTAQLTRCAYYTIILPDIFQVTRVTFFVQVFVTSKKKKIFFEVWQSVNLFQIIITCECVMLESFYLTLTLNQGHVSKVMQFMKLVIALLHH